MAWEKATLRLTFKTGTDMETGKDITKSKYNAICEEVEKLDTVVSA